MHSALAVVAAIMAACDSASVHAAALDIPSLARRQAAPSGVPQFVLDHAPIVHLHSQDPYHPNPPSAHLAHIQPTLNRTPIPASSLPPAGLTLSNLAALNDIPDSNGGQDIYLSATDDFTQLPAWLEGEAPGENGGIPGACVVVVNEKGGGVVDAFYFYFYSYNQGNKVLNHELGDHVGDWEHNAIRFNGGMPQSAWYSAHNNGEAFKWNAAPKEGTNQNRLTVYSANGTHATYATPGTHDHTIPDVPLPRGPLEDFTDAGPTWDPLVGASFYRVSFAEGTADGEEGGMRFEGYAGDEPTGFLEFKGMWGDQELEGGDERQREFFGVKKYSGGPTGPRDKQLNRVKICPDNGIPCVVRAIVGPGG